ncbi:LytTR family transcriptional regulator [Geobacillus subterraneus]|uniref:LytTR family transcriptional regulator n=2 Tax=Geobacillus TaxID=129337 RepID=A0ABM6ABF2_9BACL|nr:MULTISPECIES: LytTR family DNA-binding domain-containing protein [Geobacillus]AMX83624.1 LytTR family transcriptional regulator [Geobacillus subterraneus]KZS24536.1 DNA-binding response regulator [Geobacillus subterraneus]OXB87842.1 DNA-binding response regulator [Geobacillus uzenensis]QIZ67769.1 response regulator transcription factor [Geobacillus subterraneus]
MNDLKVLIADDDAVSRAILRNFIRLFPNYDVVAEAATGEELLQLVFEKQPDIVLVDIGMPGLDGIEAVKLCRQSLPDVQVIFTTGYDEFAVKAFELSAADYIVKPIERTRLFQALEKARKFIEIARHPVVSMKSDKRLEIRSKHSIVWLPLEDVLFVEKENRKTIIHTADEQYETTTPLNDIEKRLTDCFLKTHRSYIINLKKVVKIVQIGETYAAHFFGCEKVAYISKLKFHEVQQKMSTIHL